MARAVFSRVWLTCFFVTPVVYVVIGIASRSRLQPTNSNNEVFREMSSICDHNNALHVKSQRIKNSSPVDSYLAKPSGRLRRSTANTTLRKNRTIELNKEIDFITPHSGGMRNKGKGTEHFIHPVALTCAFGKKSQSCENKCSNQTRFVSSDLVVVPICGCDSACNAIFMDCCSDYTKHCENNANVATDPVYLARSYFQCETKLKLMTKLCKVSAGVWMITRCPKHWSDNVVRDRCQTPPSQLNNQSYDSFAPVFSQGTQLTYRNQYCALCHNVTQYEFWTLVFQKGVVPPAHFKRVNLMKFIEEYAHKLEGVAPRLHQPLRYCFMPTVIKTCPDLALLQRQQCRNGIVEIVHWNNKVYKNRACSLCHNVKSPCDVPQQPSIFSTTCFRFVNPRIAITHAVDFQFYPVSVVTKSCPPDHVFDPYLGSCRRSYRPLLQKSSEDSYQVNLWLLKYSRKALIRKSSLQDDIAQNFKLNTSQVVNIKAVEKPSDFTITFSLHLTSLQSLILSSKIQSSWAIELQRLFRFEEAFNLELSGYSGRTNFTVYRVAVRRLSCIHSRIYGFQEYVLLDADQRIYVNSTGVVYEQYEYELLYRTSRGPNVTVCLKLVPLRCNGSYIKLNSSEYDLLPNLTLLYKSLKYGFRDYAYENQTVYICVGFKRKHQIFTSEKRRGQLILAIITLVGFILSVVSLSALIVTYSIFKQLRSLPGKNIMSLALSLALAEIFWMFRSALSKNQSLCTGTAIANHYFFMVFFTASSVIAFHSCSVFGRSIPLRRSQEEKNKQFVLYFLTIWGVPVLFVLTCFLLDYYGSFTIDYGGSDMCWLSTRQSILFLFVLPFGASLLFNLSLFVFIVSRLCKNRKSNSEFLAIDISRKRNKENVFICIKLATLMGFSWLFLLFHIIVGSETDAFLYLFVIFVSLQGVFISVAFLFNRRCFTLYHDLLFKNTASGAGSNTTK